jgi:hypothetical protein
MTSHRGINILRGIRGAGASAAVGFAAVAALCAFVPLGATGYQLCAAVVTVSACAGWATYAPDGKHRFIEAILILFVVGSIAVDLAAVHLRDLLIHPLLVPILALALTTGGLTTMRVWRARVTAEKV